MSRNTRCYRMLCLVCLFVVPMSLWLGCATTKLAGPYTVPTQLNFGSVPPGADNTLHFIVYNPDSLAVDLKLRSSRPFEVVGSNQALHLEPKSAVTIPIRFHSDGSKSQNGSVSLGIAGLKVACRANQPGQSQPTRSKLLQPFSSRSIWNMPLGDGAQYKAAGFKATIWLDKDDDYFLYDGRTQPLYAAKHWWPDICDGQEYLRDVFVPDDLVTPANYPGNNSAGFLLGDGRTLAQANPISRCQAGDPVYCGWPTDPDTVDIYGDGRTGGHGGSGLSSNGGTIRPGELTGSQPIRHVLKLNVQAEYYCSELHGGFRWPAWRADGYALETDVKNPNYAHRYNAHGTAVPGVGMGALVALPPWINIDMLGLQTEPAKKLARTLQDYGAYIADDTYYPTVAFALEKGAVEEFEACYEFKFTCNTGPWHDDMMLIYEKLCVVDNNSPTSVGGGGNPRQPLAPPIGD